MHEAVEQSFVDPLDLCRFGIVGILEVAEGGTAERVPVICPFPGQLLDLRGLRVR